MPQFVLSSHANDAKTMRAIVLVILTGIRAWTPSPRPRRCTALRAHPAFKQKKDPKYSLEAAVEAGEAAQRASVPQSFDDVLDEMGASVAAALDAGGERFLVEVLPPGLNPELEMTCPYDPSRELAVVQALLNAIPRRVIRVACPSAGDAAMAARALDVEGCSFCGLSSAPGAGKDPAGVVKRVFGKAPDVPDCVLVVRPRNSVGDPVIEDVMTCVDLRIDLHAIDATPADSTQVMTCAEAAGGVGASVVLLNPDLGMKVALGIHQKDRWAAFVRSFAPAYHFSNWCSYERPSCRQIERGLVRYTHTGQWEGFHTIPQLDSFNGDLKRYGRPFGAEGAPPVPFLRAFGGAERLSRDDLAQEMKHGAKLAKVLRAA